MARITSFKPETWSDTESIESDQSFWIYCIAEAGREEVGPCKVGIATDMSKRLSSLQGGNWRELVLMWQVRVSCRDFAKEVEQYCLGMLRPNPYGHKVERRRLKSEWVEASPARALEVAMMLLKADPDNEVSRVS